MAGSDATRFWDEQAATFDQEPDHGLLDPAVRQRWSRLLMSVLPEPPATVADLGCGTGSLATLLAESGYDVTGVDLSPNMIAAATTKARTSGVAVTFIEGDAAEPTLPSSTFDAVVARHVLWALPDPAAVLARWFDLLAEDGVMVLIEGRWSTGTGLTADQLSELVATVTPDASLHPLDDPQLWGRTIDDERYLIVAHA
jgi:ubiquinone/menaquinone biosynthesis C-methylase UbiE